MMNYKVSPVPGVQSYTYPGHQTNALDFGPAAAGTPIHSSMFGTVSKVVMDYPNNFYSSNGVMSALGNYIDIVVWDGTTIRYQHLQQSNFVKEGDLINAGQQIGLMGSTGYSNPPGYVHLHFETFGGYVRNYLP